MALAWQTALPINHKAALLAMADWANDEGASLHPSIYAVAERLTCSERTAQRLLKDLADSRWIAVVGNLNGGKPGATRHYRINVRKLREEAATEEARRNVERAARRAKNATQDDLPNPFETGDSLSRVTNQVETGDKSGRGGVTNQVETGDTGVTLSTKEPPKEPPEEPLQPAMPVAVVVKVDHGKETELQAACRATWSAYSDAYAERYGTAPVRNSAVNTKVKQLVQRLPHHEAPAVAAFFVKNINDAFVVRGCHPVGALLQNAESYRTQWATGRTATVMTAAAETTYQRSMRERMEEAAPEIARKAPGQQGNPVEFFNAIDVPSRTVEQIK